MSIRNEITIENKIKELEEQLNPPQYTKYDINNNIMKPTFFNNYNTIQENLRIHAKIDALKWCLNKKRVLK